jgi:lysozyme family protein
MAQSSYAGSLSLVLAHEGGYVNHPHDPGGETNYGITIAVARANGYAGPMRSIPMSKVKQIYRARYWDVLRCDELPAGVDYAVFDYGVNSGTNRSAKILQAIVGVPADGHIGRDTSSAVQEYVKAHGAATLIEAICDERLAFLKRLKTWPTFGKGWSRRVAEVRRDARAMAAVPASPPGVEPAQPAAPGALQSILAAVAALFKKRG